MKRKPFKKSRRAAEREPRRIYYLYCEGQNTEPGYFAALRRVVREALIEIQAFGDAGDPRALSTAAIAAKKSLRRKSKNSFEKNDEVWAVFDRDDHAHYYDAIKSCVDNGVQVANSNPCFELWLLLHVEEYHKPTGREEIYKVLRALRPDYDPIRKTLNFDDLIKTVDAAENRGERLVKCRTEECNGKALGPPYTMVFELTRSIRNAAKKSK